MALANGGKEFNHEFAGKRGRHGVGEGSHRVGLDGLVEGPLNGHVAGNPLSEMKRNRHRIAPDAIKKFPRGGDVGTDDGGRQPGLLKRAAGAVEDRIVDDHPNDPVGWEGLVGAQVAVTVGHEGKVNRGNELTG